jgi:hypothetical protein
MTLAEIRKEIKEMNGNVKGILVHDTEEEITVEVMVSANFDTEFLLVEEYTDLAKATKRGKTLATKLNTKLEVSND